jgi:hypothetical protein
MFEDEHIEQIKTYGRLSYMNGHRDGYTEGLYNGIFIGIVTSLLIGAGTSYLMRNNRI